MRRVIVFNQISLDGFIADIHGDMSWAHQDDAEWNAFVAQNASGGSQLILGRVTYELMAGFWPTPYAVEHMPVVAERMNNLPKVVFSRTLDKASWNNTELLRGDIAAAIRAMKEQTGGGMTILGSGTLVAQLAQAGLIDEYQMVVNPVVLGQGKSMFDGIETRLALKLTRTRIFANGNALLCYEPVA